MNNQRSNGSGSNGDMLSTRFFEPRYAAPGSEFRVCGPAARPMLAKDATGHQIHRSHGFQRIDAAP
jgi:hypothetical protein